MIDEASIVAVGSHHLQVGRSALEIGKNAWFFGTLIECRKAKTDRSDGLG
jgi:hypothetical protein